ncbi:hypothetical protein PR048_019341 [Dryococelus australis]|uniref:Uncharacterized protein n=1 Tax=Dryococelus australis TaxID=614101 RepID=A0ABQ9H3A7_9NEOP|nr:hypothetical protein PR048_019341 [Dryococelus australis]
MDKIVCLEREKQVLFIWSAEDSTQDLPTSIEKKKLKIHHRRKVFHVRSTDFDRTVANARNDDWGETVLRRINNIGDLHAADDIYNEDCYKKFLLVKAPTGQKRGRPQEEYVGEAVEEIFHYLDEQDKDQYSMDELMDHISGAKTDMKWVMVKMVENYPPSDVFLNGAEEMVPAMLLALQMLLSQRGGGLKRKLRRKECAFPTPRFQPFTIIPFPGPHRHRLFHTSEIRVKELDKSTGLA